MGMSPNQQIHVEYLYYLQESQCKIAPSPAVVEYCSVMTWYLLNTQLPRCKLSSPLAAPRPAPPSSNCSSAEGWSTGWLPHKGVKECSWKFMCRHCTYFVKKSSGSCSKTTVSSNSSSWIQYSPRRYVNGFSIVMCKSASRCFSKWWIINSAKFRWHLHCCSYPDVMHGPPVLGIPAPYRYLIRFDPR